MEDNYEKNIFQAVSGGYDNTYLLIKNLQNGDNFYPIYIYANFIHPIKQKIESSKVKNLIRKLRKKYKKLRDLTESQITIDPIRSFFSTQPISWIINLFNKVKEIQYSVKFDEVHIGYIKNDYAIDYLSAIKTIWKLFFSFSCTSRVFKIPKLCFPLSKYSKKYIIEKIRSYDENILSLCWTCERPKAIKTVHTNNTIEVFIEACGSCNPCNNLKKIKNISFDKIKKYKVVFNHKEYRNQINKKFDNMIKNGIISCFRPKYFSLKYAKNNK